MPRGKRQPKEEAQPTVEPHVEEQLEEQVVVYEDDESTEGMVTIRISKRTLSINPEGVYVDPVSKTPITKNWVTLKRNYFIEQLLRNGEVEEK